MSWKDTLKIHFKGRQLLSLSDLIRQFGLSGTGADTILSECLGLFEQEYGVPIGLLRPDDSLRLFTDPPRTKNPISWFYTRAAYEDSTSELNYRLKKRLRALGRDMDRPPMTIRDYVTAWVGDIDSAPSTPPRSG